MDATRPIANSFLGASKHKKLMTLAGLYISIMVGVMVTTGGSTLLPAAAAEIGGQDIYPLASTIGGVLGIVCMPLFGYLAAKNPALMPVLLSFSLAVGAVVVLMRASAPSMTWVIVVSFFWGIESAGNFVLGYSLIRVLYPAERSGALLGVAGTCAAIGMMAGPFLTGLIIDHFDWRVVCHVEWPLLLIASALVFFGARIRKADAAAVALPGTKFDFAGAGFLVVALSGVILCLSLGSNFIPFGGTANNALIVMTVVAIGGLVTVLRRKGAAAIVPSPVLADRNTALITVSLMLMTFSSMAAMFFVPAYILRVMGESATAAALTTTLLAIAGVVLGPIFGRRIGSTGDSRGVLAIGGIVRILVTVGLLVLLSPSLPLWVVYILMFLAGVYNSVQTITSSTIPQIQIRPEFRLMGNSVVQVGLALGGGLGLSVYTLVIASYGVVDGIGVAFAIALVAAVASFVLGFFIKKVDVHEDDPVPVSDTEILVMDGITATTASEFSPKRR